MKEDAKLSSRKFYEEIRVSLVGMTESKKIQTHKRWFCIEIYSQRQRMEKKQQSLGQEHLKNI